MGGQGGLSIPQGLRRVTNGRGGSLNGGMPGGNPGWGIGPQSHTTTLSLKI